jgi:hypothetical protein
VGVEDSGGQALVPRDGGAEVPVCIIADLVEALAHEVCICLDGVAVGDVESLSTARSAWAARAVVASRAAVTTMLRKARRRRFFSASRARRLMASSVRLRSTDRTDQLRLSIFWVAWCVSSRAARQVAPRVWEV